MIVDISHEHQFSCTCCHGAICPLHDEGIRHCVVCDKSITDDDEIVDGRFEKTVFRCLSPKNNER
jgi:hypothetical protein